MKKIEKKLEEIKKRKRIGIMAHVVVGYPSLDETIETVKTMVESGVDFIELQIPFSDPLADGQTIMKACETSLANGTKVHDAFVVMKKLSQDLSVPILFMCYYNTVFTYGVKRFCRDAKEAGASGLIVPDMPIDEEGEEGFYAACKKHDLHTIQVLSPASTVDRLKRNAAVASGFVYFTARQGTTGAKDQLDLGLGNYLQKMRKFFSIPIAVGFGISKRDHIRMLKKNADIAIIGSAVIDLTDSSPKEKIQENIRRFFNELMVQ